MAMTLRSGANLTGEGATHDVAIPEKEARHVTYLPPPRAAARVPLGTARLEVEQFRPGSSAHRDHRLRTLNSR